MELGDSSVTNTGTKSYQIRQVDCDGATVASIQVDANSSEAAAKQLDQIADGAESIKICLDGDVMNEMGVDYWQKRVRRR